MWTWINLTVVYVLDINYMLVVLEGQVGFFQYKFILPSLFNFKEESNMPKGYMSKMGKPVKKKKKKKKK